MKVLFGLVIFCFLTNANAQSRPGGAGGSGSGDTEALRGPEFDLLYEFQKRAAYCEGPELANPNILQMYEFFQSEELNELLTGHNHEKCQDFNPKEKHVAYALNCYFTDKFKRELKKFLNHPEAMSIIQNSSINLKKSKVEVSPEDAKAIWTYLNSFVSPNKQ